MAITEEDLRAFVAAFNAHDPEAVMEFFADACVFETPRGSHPWGERLVGKAAVLGGVQGRFKGLPDVHYGEDEHWLVGNDHAVSRWLLTGTTADGTRLEVRGCDLLDINAEGKITRKDSYWKIVTEQ